MPDTITPISNLATIGLNKDNPPVSLPPNAFTDALNVRFRHGSISKIPGEKSIANRTPTELGVPDGEFIFITEWSNPNLGDNNSYYLIIIRDDNTNQDHIILVRALPFDLDVPEYREVGVVDSGGIWQSTLFQGGYAIIINNGIEVPYYLLDTEGGTAFNSFTLKQLPNWDSYFSSEIIIDATHDDKLDEPSYSAGTLIDFTTTKLVVEVYDITEAYRGSIEVTGNGTYQWSNHDALFVVTDTDSNTTVLTPQYDNANNTAILDGERFVVYKVSLAAQAIRAGLIKAYGDFLIAGDLRQVDSSTGVTLRQLPGLIRTSNIAAPGSLPNNWNPYATGANTADEIQLASTGIIRDMVPLQNQMVIYTDRSIHSLNVTGNPNSPFSVINVTDAYGAMTLDSVIEFDGRHLVIGNNDIYLFGGHPGSIQSVAENKVRDFFYRDINKEFINKTFIFRNISKDEIWINYPSGLSEWANKTLIWNYKSNCFTIRMMGEMRSGFAGRIAQYGSIDGGDSNTGPANTEVPKDEFVSTADAGDIDDPITDSILGDDADIFEFDSARKYPIFCDSMHIYYAEADGVFIDHEDNVYESRVARIELPMTPEFDSEMLNSLALWTTRKSNENIDLAVFVQTHNSPTGDDVVFNMSSQHTFTIGEDYKVDVRAKGRFFDYIITDKPTSSSQGVASYWAISGMQTKVGKGGSR